MSWFYFVHRLFCPHAHLSNSYFDLQPFWPDAQMSHAILAGSILSGAIKSCNLKAYLPSTFCLNWNINAHMKRSVIYPSDRWYCVKTSKKRTYKVVANQIILIFEGTFIGLFSPQFIHDDRLFSSCLSIKYITTTSHSSLSDSLNNPPFRGYTYILYLYGIIHFVKTFKGFQVIL